MSDFNAPSGSQSADSSLPEKIELIGKSQPKNTNTYIAPLVTSNANNWQCDSRPVPSITFLSKKEPLAKRIAKRTGATVFWSALGLILVIAVLIYVIPQAKAGAGLTVLTSSMETSGRVWDSVLKKNISPGDVVAVKGIKAHEVCERVKVGDVVTYMPEADDGTLVTHRVIAVNVEDQGNTIGEDIKYETCTVQMQGDANNVADPVVPSRAVKGTVMYTVPKVGYALNAVQTNTSMRTIAIGIAAALALAAGYFLIPRYAKVHEIEYHI